MSDCLQISTCWVHFKYLLLILNFQWKDRWFPQMKKYFRNDWLHPILKMYSALSCLSILNHIKLIFPGSSRHLLEFAVLHCQYKIFKPFFMPCHCEITSVFRLSVRSRFPINILFFFSDSTLQLNLAALLLMFRVPDEIFSRCSFLHILPRGSFFFTFQEKHSRFDWVRKLASANSKFLNFELSFFNLYFFTFGHGVLPCCSVEIDLGLYEYVKGQNKILVKIF